MSFYTPHFNPESVEIGRVHNNDNNQRNDELQHINHPYTFHIFIDSDDKELQNKYINKINSHNAMVDNNSYPDSGFDLFIPTEFSGEYQPHTRTKVDYKVIGMMEYSLSKKIVPYTFILVLLLVKHHFNYVIMLELLIVDIVDI